MLPDRLWRVSRLPVSVLAAAALLASGLVAATPARAVSPNLVISQVYGGGGNSGAPFTHDFVEIYNRGASDAPLGGLSIQYASATGTGNLGANSGQLTELPDITVEPGQYVLVQEASQATVGAAPPTPDVTDATPIAMAATSGKVALVTGDASLGCNGGSVPCSAAAQARIVDLVGYGSANFFEGDAAAPSLSNTTAALRKGAGSVDTDDNGADFSAGTPTPRNSASLDAAPTVKTTVPAAGSTDVLLDDDIAITFSEPVDVMAPWFAISCATSGPHSASVSGGPTSFTLHTAEDFVYGDVCTVGITAAQVSDQDVDDPPDTMKADYTFSFAALEADPCAADITPIYDIQGPGSATPLAGSPVLTRGVVSANLPGLSGFALQDVAGDGNVQTSDGVFVFVPNANRFADEARVLQPGDVVAVKSTPKEFQGLTELDSVTVLVKCGTADALRPEIVTLPEKTDGELEQVEGMLVTFPQRITVEQNFFLGRYGQLTVGVQGRTYQPTNQFPAGSAQAIELADRNRRSLFVLDDAFSGQNPNPIPYIGDDGVRRAGDTIVGGVTGILDFGAVNSNSAIRDYRLQPTAEPEFTNTNERTAEPEPVRGSLKVASFNVLNYFTTFTGSSARGADNAAEFARQRTKIFAAMAAIDADVFGLMEIQNSNVALNDLVTGLNEYLGAPVYAAVSDVGLNVGSDAIKVALIYKPSTASPVGAATSYPDPSFLGQGRVPVAQTFEEVATGERLSVVVNHFKSKGSCPTPGNDPANEDLGDGQGCWNALRVEEARALLEYIGDIQEASDDDDVLVIGDLNSYAEEDPILALEAGGLVNEIERWVGKKAYSYVFDGLAGYLDHALATESLHAQVVGATEWHINADEPSVIDYNLEFKPEDLYEPTPYRSSDHDPVVVGLRLR